MSCVFCIDCPALEDGLVAPCREGPISWLKAVDEVKKRAATATKRADFKIPFIEQR
jgi:hypothetical protein